MAELKNYPAYGAPLPGPRDGLMQDIARFPGVQAILGAHADTIAGHARALLAEHRVEGEARIDVKRERIDHYVILNDKAGVSIEYGRRPSERDGGMAGLFILHRAAGLAGGRHTVARYARLRKRTHGRRVASYKRLRRMRGKRG